MVDTLPNLQAVYAKWEGNNPYSRGGPPRNYGNRAPPSLMSDHMSSGDYNRMLAGGREAWKTQYSTHGTSLPVRRNKSTRHGRAPNSLASLSLSEVMSNSLAHFKSNPSVHPNVRPRPFTGRCCTCMPNSRNTFYNDELRESGFKNLLQLDTSSPENGWLTRMFCVCAHVLTKRCSFKYPSVSTAVLASPRLQEAVNKTVTEETAAVDRESPKLMSILKRQQKKVEARAKHVVTRMKAVVSSQLIRFVAWFLHKLLGRLLSSIVVHKGQMQIVKLACQRDLPVIFLPTHRSHLDYILITFILFNHDILAPHVAAGDNLLIPFFGALMRGLGGYFIRRKLDKHGKKDHVYRAVLHQYMCELLKRNQNFEFFVEGGRTRSGKAIYPKGGLLSVIVDAFNEGIIPDAYIVPISISYDRILDGNFCREQMGEPKLRETFWRACTALWAVIMSHYGSVRVDFSQPFSLKESIQVSQNSRNTSVNNSRGEPSPGCDSPTTPDGVIKLSASEGSIYGTEIIGEDQRQLIQGLAEHIVHEQNCNTAAMSTHMVALLLLTKHRQGVHINTLIEDFDWLKLEINNRGRDLGFTGKTPDVVSHALSLLGHKLATKEPLSDDNEPVVKDEGIREPINNNDAARVFVRPTVSLPNVFELSYYANITNSLFVVESALANALHGLVEKDAWTSLTRDSIGVSQQRLLASAEVICHFLKYEYIFTPPCIALDQTMMEGFDRLTCAEILQRPEENEGCEDSRERDWARRLDKTLSFAAEDDSEEEDWAPPDVFYEVNKDDSYCMAKLTFLRQILAPILETYYIAACNTISLVKQDMPEDDFVLRTHAQLKERVQSGVAGYAESASLDTVKNAVRSFQHNKIISCYQTANIRMISLKHSYKSEESVHAFIQQFEAYRD